MRQSTIFSRVRGLLEVTRLVRSGNELPVLLLAIARTVSDSLGFRTVVINVYRREWDDFVVTTVYGSDEAREALLGQVRQHSDWAPLLDERFLNRGAYLVPHGEFDWSELDAYTPELPEPEDPSMWHPEDALFVPLRDAEGNLLGVLSVDEPSSGRRPAGDEIDVLVAVSEHAALAVQAAQETARTQSNRDALAQLLGVSSRLNEWTDSTTLLEHVCSAISEALGFQRVAVQLLEDDGHHRTAATAGFGPGENIGRAMTADQLERLLRPEFDIAGCYLIPDDAAHALLPDRGGGYRSQHDGRGPHAWSNHWLFVPLYDRRSRRIGYIWVDDPDDRLIPDAERLQILRLFANQATTALEVSAQLEAVQNSNERYRALIDASPVAIINFDFEGRVRSWNAGATALFGWTAGETVGRPNPTLPEDERGSFDDLNRVRAGETLRDLDRRRLRSGGELIDVSISAGPIRDAHGDVVGVIALMVDVTARKRSERALAASEARKEAILRAALDSVVLIDEAGLVIEMNPAAEETFGWTVSDAIGRPFIELAVAPEHRASLAEALDGIGSPVEITAMRSDHRTFPAEASITRVDVTGPPLYAVSLRDVTRRREHEERLIAAEAKYRTLVEQIPLATYVNDIGTPIRTTYMSPQIEEMLGYPVSAWLEPDFFPTILHPADRERVIAEVERTHRAGEPFRQEYRLLRPDGEAVWVLDETVAVRDEQYRPLFLQGFLVDISDRRSTETPTGGSLRA